MKIPFVSLAIGVWMTVALFLIVSPASADPAPDDIQTGLLLYYDFEELPQLVGLEILVPDASGNALDGTVFGGAQRITDAAVGNGAFSFNGTNGYIQVNSDTAGLLDQGGPFTVSLWVNSDELIPPPAIEARSPIGKHQVGGNSNSYWMWLWRFIPPPGVGLGPSFNMQIWRNGGPSSCVPETCLTVPVACEMLQHWAFVTMTFDGSTYRAYLNGNEVNGSPQTSSIGMLGNAHHLLIGAGEYNGSAPQRHWLGSVDEVRVYNRALEQPAVRELYELASESVRQPACNQPPLVDAGANIQIVSSDQPVTTLQGMITDPDGNELHYRWLEGTHVLGEGNNVPADGVVTLSLAPVPPVPYFSTGNHTIILEGSDGYDTIQDEMVLTVNNSQPSAVASGGGTVELGNNVMLGGDVADYDGDTLAYTWREGSYAIYQNTIETLSGGDSVALTPFLVISGPPLLPLGSHTITLEVTDGVTAPRQSEIIVNVVDTQVPTLQPIADIGILWPPNHKMRTVTIDTQTADNSSNVTLEASVVSSEAPDLDGDGNTILDFTVPEINQDTGEITLDLRAERKGNGDGRTYTITITATDDSGNSSSADVKVVAPHDQGH